MTKRLWTEDDDNYLREHYPRGDIDSIVTNLNRTAAAIRYRACKIDVHLAAEVRGAILAGNRRNAQKLTGRLIPCAYEGCRRGDDGGRRLFPEVVSANPRRFCCKQCRQADRYRQPGQAAHKLELERRRRADPMTTRNKYIQRYLDRHAKRPERTVVTIPMILDAAPERVEEFVNRFICQSYGE